MFNEKSITLCTRVMNRESHLRQVLPSWLAIEEIDKYVIVDWSSSPKLKNLAKDSRVVVIRKDDEKFFRRSAAWNLGLKEVQTDLALLIDCDVFIRKSPFNLVDVGIKHLYYIISGIREGAFGTCIVTKDQINAIKGFDERIENYGYEDMNFYHRLERASFRSRSCITNSYVEHIHHGDDLRFKNQPIQKSFTEVNWKLVEGV